MDKKKARVEFHSVCLEKKRTLGIIRGLKKKKKRAKTPQSILTISPELDFPVISSEDPSQAELLAAAPAI